MRKLLSKQGYGNEGEPRYGRDRRGTSCRKIATQGNARSHVFGKPRKRWNSGSRASQERGEGPRESAARAEGGNTALRSGVPHSERVRLFVQGYTHADRVEPAFHLIVGQQSRSRDE